MTLKNKMISLGASFFIILGTIVIVSYFDYSHELETRALILGIMWIFLSKWFSEMLEEKDV